MDYDLIEKRARGRQIGYLAAIGLVLVLWAIIVLFPFYWMLLTSVKSYGSYSSEFVPKLFTLHPTPENYASAFSQVPLAGYFLNTAIFTVITTALMLFVTVLAAFAFSRLRFPGRDLIFAAFLALMMIPSVTPQMRRPTMSTAVTQRVSSFAVFGNRCPRKGMAT